MLAMGRIRYGTIIVGILLATACTDSPELLQPRGRAPLAASSNSQRPNGPDAGVGFAMTRIQQGSLPGPSSYWMIPVIYALSYQEVGASDVTARAHGHSVFDNLHSNPHTHTLIPDLA